MMEYSEKTFPSATLSTTNPTFCPDANPGRRGGKPATNGLSYSTAIWIVLILVLHAHGAGTAQSV
jgi:hypothetical protein